MLEGLESAAGGTDVAALDATIGGLAKRQFLLVSAKASRPTLFRAAQVRDDLQELEEEIADRIAAIDARWQTIAQETDTIAIRPEAADVTVERPTLVWVPGEPGGGS